MTDLRLKSKWTNISMKLWKISEFLKQNKIQELNDIYNIHDDYMKKNESAWRKFIQLSKKVLDISML